MAATTARDRALTSAKTAATTTSSANQFTPGQLTFINEYANKTGLDKNVVAAEVFNEENGSAARYYEGKGDNDWLNIGRTDSGNFGAGDSVWSDPVKAADESAAWVKGDVSLPGFGHASSGIQQITKSAGKSPAEQIRAIQTSGWASSGYPSLPGIYESVSGQPLASTGPVAQSGSSTGVTPQQAQGTPLTAQQPATNPGIQALMANLTGKPAQAAQKGLSVPLQLAMAILGKQQAASQASPITLSPMQLAQARQSPLSTSMFGPASQSIFTPLGQGR